MREDKITNKVRIIFVALAAVLLAGLIPVSSTALACTTPSSCNAELQTLRRQQEQAKANYEKNKRDAQNIQGVIADLQSDIIYTEGLIANTLDQISLSEKIITQLNGDISHRQEKLSRAYVALYEMARTSNSEIVFSRSINDRLSQAQYVESIQSQLNKEVGTLQLAHKEESSQKVNLEQLRVSLESEKNNLAQKKSRQNYLLGVTQSNASYYADLSSELQRKIAQVEDQIDRLTRRNSWGTDIISGPTTSWYYTQKYNYTQFKYCLDDPTCNNQRNTGYTVHQYGCLITSYAMLSNFYGRPVSPSTIAQDGWNFTSEAYLRGRAQPPRLTGLTETKQSISWAKLDQEVSQGRPVIVSIFIPEIGVVNPSDGSSHWIVIYGKRSDGKYLMQDPLGQNRSYGFAQVKTLKVIRH